MEEKKKILVVDDSGIYLRSIKKMLDETYDVSVVNAGLKAITYLQENTVDLIILDYDMPDIDGEKTFELLKQNDSTKDIPVVFLTGVNDREHIGRVLGLRPAAYILKPPDQYKLLRTIRDALNNEIIS